MKKFVEQKKVLQKKISKIFSTIQRKKMDSLIR